MLAMQYTIELPSNYDFRLISERVEKRSALFDNLPGLVHKSFLWNAHDRLYAPFYVWKDNESARQFILNDLFKGVIASFSRPRVRQWSVMGCVTGPCTSPSAFATREADVIPSEESLPELVQREREKQAELKNDPNLAFHAIALDTERWELIRYSVWKDEASAVPPEADCIHRYEVLHISAPEARKKTA